MAKSKQNLQGLEAFEAYYSALYGSRWPALYQALQTPAVKVPLQAPWTEPAGEIYSLDPASALVPTVFDLKEQQKVLDLCSAPGGKALGMLYRTEGKLDLTCNELSPQRIKRLRAVLRQHLPEEIFSKIKIVKSDGSRWGMAHKEEFDHVLLDAPCSGERHLLQTPAELKTWSPRRGKGLHQRQVALICSAFDCLRPGGSLVYSTCSLNPLENDGVLAKLAKKREGVEIQKLHLDVGEPTENGWIILPTENNWGPIFLSKVLRCRWRSGRDILVQPSDDRV